MTAPLLEMRGIVKTFPGVRALAGVDFTLRAGEIHALMGENGAGKSTLVKVLTGVYPRDAGDVRLEGVSIEPRSPHDAEACGIATVYQEVNLIPYLSVAENISLGREPVRMGLIRWKEMRKRAEHALARLGLHIDVEQDLSSYSLAIQQMVAIARALDLRARLLVLDEPTSSLDEREVQELFAVLRRLKAEGMGIVFITHFMDQVYALSDRITVLRDGHLVGEYEAASLPRLELVARMIGKTPEDVAAMEQQSAVADPLEEEPFLAALDLGRTGALHPLNLAVRRGEVLGLAGLLGSGRTETARLLFGVDRATSGHIQIGGKNTSIHSPRQAIQAGLAMTPEDRKDAGLALDLSVRENMMLALQAQRGLCRPIREEEQHALVDEYIRALGIRTPSPEQAIRNLSGGNQQKVLLARWLLTRPALLILDEPTRGIDVGAKADIEKLIESLRAEGMALIFISGELEEVARIAQRVLVMRDRRLVGVLAGSALTLDAIMRDIAAAPEEADT